MGSGLWTGGWCGKVVLNPRHYREAHAQWMEEVLHLVKEEELYAMSGVLPQQINTVFNC
ncbi:hypothetical protein Q0F98_39800 [Paenibacillus amylolyticus]|nr:hypothetical protein Q0F98_39800 [Paenibacillus amylolyticus]